MHEILEKEVLADKIVSIRVQAPRISAKAAPGQFVIVRSGEDGERIPLTIADYDGDDGTVTLVVQEAGMSTKKLARMNPGQSIGDMAGPLGMPSKITRPGRVLCIGGGVGIAPVFPVARAFREAGNDVTAILAAKTAGMIFWEEKFVRAGINVIVCTEDGSAGVKGMATDALDEIISQGPAPGLVLAVGPAAMMKAVSDKTRAPRIKTIVSLNPIMVDGTGMCGGCRVNVGGKTFFACVDGPEFDGHKVDFEELSARQKFYSAEERVCGKKHCRAELSSQA